MSLSTAQARALRAVRDASDNARGLIPPIGPACRPYKFLVSRGLLECKPGESLHYITKAGREMLATSDAGATPPAP